MRKTKKRLNINGQSVIIDVHLELIGGIFVEKIENKDEDSEGKGRGYFNFYGPTNEKHTEHLMMLTIPEAVMQSFIQESIKKSIKQTAVLMDDRRFVGIHN